MSGVSGKVRSRVRTQWLALGAALVVLAGVLVAWALSNAADRVQVVRVAQALQAGDVIGADDLTVTGVAYDPDVQGLVPAASVGVLVGRVAAIDLQPGVIVQVGMWRDTPQLGDGEESVGALLRSGRFPAGLARGDIAVAAPVVGPVAGSAVADAAVAGSAVDGLEVAGSGITVRVIDVATGADGAMSVTLAVPTELAIVVAQLAATDQLLLVGRSTSVGS